MGDRTIKLAEFSGDVLVDKMTIDEYLNHVRMSALAAAWDDAVTAEKVKLKLVGHARTWLQNRIREETLGLDAYDPPVVANVKPPGLRALLLNRFMPVQTAGEQQRLRATLNQGENESVQVFYDRVDSVQYILDLDLPEDFRLVDANKRSYQLVHAQQVRGNFVAGLKTEIRTHVVSLATVVTLADVLAAAIAYEKARATKPANPARVAGAAGGTTEEQDFAARLAALELRRQQGGGAGKLADEGCFYCGWVGHIKPECNIRKGDEAKGIFQTRCTGYIKGRVGRGRGQRGGGQRGQRGGRGGRGGEQRGGWQARGGYAAAAGGSQGQNQQQQQPQQPPVPVVYYQTAGFQPPQQQQQQQQVLPTQNQFPGGFPGSASAATSPEMFQYFQVPSQCSSPSVTSHRYGSEN